ncbi:LuxR family transcriptional regulator [Rhizobium sp. Rhizsp82]|uniref:LuxR family transcriptional regulator n=1 Tax=Rhizobium sp. Rhizsp82 TaxID=3243057 RepID=UPI0039B43FE3
MKTWILPPFEMTCLRWVARGKTLAEIALLEGKDVTEIELCLERAVAMLDAKSVEEAIVKASESHSGRG